MKRKIAMLAAVSALTVGSLFAFTGGNERTSLTSCEQCAPGCCEDDVCTPEECEAACDPSSCN